MLFVALTYLVYALNVGSVREMLGQPKAQYSTALDAIQPATAVVIVLVSWLKFAW
jgi:hypothetical protein